VVRALDLSGHGFVCSMPTKVVAKGQLFTTM
jgi:hypothetical protein